MIKITVKIAKTIVQEIIDLALQFSGHILRKHINFRRNQKGMGLSLCLIRVVPKLIP